MLWLISVFLSVMMAVMSLHNTHDVSARTEVTVTTQQRALRTVAYINAIDDYLYDHPQMEGSVPDGVLPVNPPTQVRNLIQAGRVYVWQPDSTGLLYQLDVASNASALIGKVRNSRLIDIRGVDMGVDVPADIPDGDVVYLN